MTHTRAFFAVLAAAGVFVTTVHAADEETEWHLGASNPQGWAEYDDINHVWVGTNGVYFQYAGTLLNADSMSINPDSGQILADGAVRIQHEEQLWVGEHMAYNFKTRQMEARQ